MTTIGKTSPHARKLRRDAPDAERRLWYYLRDRRLGGFKFRRQVTIGPFIADFACIPCKLIVEVDGSQHNELADRPRTEWFENLGWRVLRFWNNDVLQNTDGVVFTILAACGAKEELPSPCPLPLAGEGL